MPLSRHITYIAFGMLLHTLFFQTSHRNTYSLKNTKLVGTNAVFEREFHVYHFLSCYFDSKPQAK